MPFGHSNVLNAWWTRSPLNCLALAAAHFQVVQPGGKCVFVTTSSLNMTVLAQVEGLAQPISPHFGVCHGAVIFRP